MSDGHGKYVGHDFGIKTDFGVGNDGVGMLLLLPLPNHTTAVPAARSAAVFAACCCMECQSRMHVAC